MSTKESNRKNKRKFLYTHFSEEKGKTQGKQEDINVIYKI